MKQSAPRVLVRSSFRTANLTGISRSPKLKCSSIDSSSFFGLLSSCSPRPDVTTLNVISWRCWYSWYWNRSRACPRCEKKQSWALDPTSGPEFAIGFGGLCTTKRYCSLWTNGDSFDFHDFCDDRYDLVLHERVGYGNDEHLESYQALCGKVLDAEPTVRTTSASSSSTIWLLIAQVAVACSA